MKKVELTSPTWSPVVGVMKVGSPKRSASAQMRAEDASEARERRENTMKNFMMIYVTLSVEWLGLIGGMVLCNNENLHPFYSQCWLE